MTIENITKEQFNLYQDVQEKEGKLKDYAIKNARERIYALLFGMVTPPMAAFTISEIASDSRNMFTIAVLGIGVLSCGLYICNSIKNIIKNYRAMNSLEKEIEQLKSEPAYKALSE